MSDFQSPLLLSTISPSSSTLTPQSHQLSLAMSDQYPPTPRMSPVSRSSSHLAPQSKIPSPQKQRLASQAAPFFPKQHPYATCKKSQIPRLKKRIDRPCCPRQQDQQLDYPSNNHYKQRQPNPNNTSTVSSPLSDLSISSAITPTLNGPSSTSSTASSCSNLDSLSLPPSISTISSIDKPAGFAPLTCSIHNTSDQGTSSPCSPTSTTHLATPEWASPDLSCRSYLTQISLNLSDSKLFSLTCQKGLNGTTITPATDVSRSSSTSIDNLNTNCMTSFSHLTPSNDFNDTNDTNFRNDDSTLTNTNISNSFPSSQVVEEEPSKVSSSLWTKRSLSTSKLEPKLESAEPSTSSYSFSFSRLGAPFSVKRQREQDPNEKVSKKPSLFSYSSSNSSTLANSTSSSSDSLPYNSYCSECSDYRNFRTKSADDINIFMECEECNSVTRRRSSAANTALSLINTSYISFPSIDDDDEDDEKDKNAACANGLNITGPTPILKENGTLSPATATPANLLSASASGSKVSKEEAAPKKSGLGQYHRFLPRLIA